VILFLTLISEGDLYEETNCPIGNDCRVGNL